jgi:hypothetical protein
MQWFRYRKITEIVFDRRESWIAEVGRKSTQYHYGLPCLGRETNVELLAMPADEAVKRGDIEEIMPLRRASFDIDKETDIGTERHLILAKRCLPCLEVPTLTIGVPDRLHLRRLLLERKAIGHLTGSVPMFHVGGGLGHRLLRCCRETRGLKKGLWRRKKHPLVSRPKEKTEIITGITKCMRRNGLSIVLLCEEIGIEFLFPDSGGKDKVRFLTLLGCVLS